MNNAKIILSTVAVVAAMFFLVGCGNSAQAGCANDADCAGAQCVAGQCVQCATDAHCNANDKCMICTGTACVKKSDCCTSDLECGDAKRCFNVPGKAYGQCQGS